MASVHPCKHSSVMKKVIERMDLAVRRAQLAEQGGAAAQGGADAKEGKEKGRKWGILSGKKKDGEAAKEGPATGEREQDGPEGLRVDQYLVVFLKFMSSIGEFSCLLPCARSNQSDAGAEKEEATKLTLFRPDQSLPSK